MLPSVEAQARRWFWMRVVYTLSRIVTDTWWVMMATIVSPVWDSTHRAIAAPHPQTQFDEDYPRDADDVISADAESNSVPGGSSLIESSCSRSPATKKDSAESDSLLQAQRQSRRRKSEGARQESRLLEAHSRPPESTAPRPPPARNDNNHKSNDKGRSKSHGNNRDKRNKKKAERNANRKSTSAKNSPCRNSPVDLVLQTSEKVLVVKSPENHTVITKTDSNLTLDLDNRLSSPKDKNKTETEEPKEKSDPQDESIHSSSEDGKVPIKESEESTDESSESVNKQVVTKTVTVTTKDTNTPTLAKTDIATKTTFSAKKEKDATSPTASQSQILTVLETNLDEEEAVQKTLEVLPESKPCHQKASTPKTVSRIPRLQPSTLQSVNPSSCRRQSDGALSHYRIKPKSTLPPTREEEPAYLRYGSTSNLSPRKEPTESKSDLKTIESLLSSRFGGDRRSFFSKPFTPSSLLFWSSKRQSASAVDLTSVGRSELKYTSALPGLRKRPSDVVLIVESTFRALYSPFHEHSQGVIRQARDLLVCSYLGSIKKFEEGFLRPAAALLEQLKIKERASTAPSDHHLQHDGWPLCYNRRVLVHLGETDSSLLKAGDFYLCVRQTASASSTVELVLKCRTSSRTIHEHVISSTHFGKVFDMDWLQSLHLETASDEQLTTLLQHMLVAVEKGIDRIRWETISRPHTCTHQASADAPKICPTCNKVLGDPPTSDSTAKTSTKAQPPLGKTVSSPADVKDSSAQTSPVEEYKQPPGASDLSPRLSAPLADEEGPLEDEEVDGGGDFTNTSCEKEKVMASKSAQNCKECILSAQVEPLVLSETTMEKDIKAATQEQDLSIPDGVPEASTNEEQDDGYHDNPLTPPTSIKEVSQQVLSSKVAFIPGCRDWTGRAVVTISATLLKSPPTISQTQLAELLMYFHTVPRKELAARGLLILVDAQEVRDVFDYLDEAFCLFEETIPGAINSVIVWKGDNPPSDETPTGLFPRSSVKYEVITSLNRLHKLIKPDQLLVETGGTYLFQLDEWIEFRQRFEPFVSECRSAGKRLVAVMQELRSSRLPPTSALTSQVIDEHKHHVLTTFEDPQLLRLQKEGAQVLSQLSEIQAKASHNADYRDGAERSSALFSELQRAVAKLARLADKRLSKLEQGLQLQNFEEDCGQVLSWLCKKGEETLKKHKTLADNLTGLRAQERDFEKFYFIAMRHIEKGHDLLEEAAMLNQGGHQEAPSGVQDLNKSLKHHLRGFSEQLEDTRERLEDTSKCYQLLDKAYEWALEAMKFVSRMKTDDTTTPDQLTRLIKALQNYVDNHPPISEDVFLDMIASATKLENERLIEQCKVAQARCQETTDLIRTRQATLLKAHQQMEAEGLHLFQSECALAPSGGRPPYQPASPPWMLPSPTTTSTPLYPFTRRRSIAAVPACGHLPPTGYSSFFRESYRLDSFISEHDEMLAEDVANVAPSHTRNRSLDARQLNFEESVRPPSNPLQGPNPPLAHTRPPKKYMKRSQTWQFEMDPWQKVSQPPTCNLHKDFQKGSTESIQTVVENEEPCSLESSTSSESSKSLPPVSVNSHLHHGGSSLNLQYQPSSNTTTDAQLTEEQMKHKRTLMLIMREMIQTERDYVKSLEYIIENYIPELLREDIPQALRGKRNVVFGNIEKIYEFHSQYFLHELEQCENAPFLVGHCFLRHERQFYLYALYNKNKPKSDELMLEYGTTFFKSKQLQLGDKMDLASYLLKPVQRMGKYALLLKQLLKECPEKDLEHTDLQAAEDMVKFQLRHGNDLLAMDCIRECDVDLKEQGRLVRQDEFIVWQGKYRKCLRQVFLFEELIVFAKARRDPDKKGHDMYQYKNSIKNTDIGLTEQVGESNTKFEIWFRKCKLNDTYTLQAANNDVKQAWVQEISKLLWRQALRNRELRLAEMSSMGIGNKPCLDIKPSEDQISDRSISIAQLTKAPRFRNSIAVMTNDHMRNNKRPHSIISVSSSSSGSSQSSYSLYGALNLGFDPTDSPKLHHRSITQQSQCSAESGIISDISVGGYDGLSEVEANKKLERTSSNASTDSMGTVSSPASEVSPGSINETTDTQISH